VHSDNHPSSFTTTVKSTGEMSTLMVSNIAKATLFPLIRHKENSYLCICTLTVDGNSRKLLNGNNMPDPYFNNKMRNADKERK